MGKIAKKVCTQKTKSMHPKKVAKISKKITEKIPNENYIESTELTEKQRLFCIFYIQNFNATQAAIRAGYSKESVYIIGYENLRKPYIKKYLSELKNLHENELLLTEKRIIERYSKIAFSDMSDYLTEEGKTFKNWLGDSEEVLNKSGLLNNPYYLEIVYRNNMNSAYNAGAFHNQELNKENKPYGLYDAVDDDRISSICKSFKWIKKISKSKRKRVVEIESI